MMLSSKQRWSAAGFILIGIAAGIIFSSGFNLTTPGIASKAELPVFVEETREPIEAPASLVQTNRAFTSAAREVLPAVVGVNTMAMVSRSNRYPDLFEFFFRRQQPENREPEMDQQRGLGSGVIVSSDGYILTNHHVIDRADEINVKLADNREFTAEIVGTDPLTEVAVIKIDAKDLPAIRLGDSDKLEVGEWVLAVGNPLYLHNTVTAGIVSALGRGIGIIDGRDESRSGNWGIESFIQTDAAINRGNSGGALVNIQGELVGINTAIASGTGYYTGYGFAIPINLAKRIMRDIIEKGRVVRPWIGISMSGNPVDQKTADYYGLDRPTGVVVQEVVDGSPAEKGGLKPLDLILKIDGQEVDRSNQVQNIVALKNPGDVVKITIKRRKSTRELDIKLAERETEETETGAVSEESISNLGLEVRTLNDDDRRELEYSGEDKGVIVLSAERFSAAWEEGIRRGVLITHIDDESVPTIDEYKRVMARLKPGDVVVFRFKAPGTGDRHAFIRIPEK